MSSSNGQDQHHQAWLPLRRSLRQAIRKKARVSYQILPDLTQPQVSIEIVQIREGEKHFFHTEILYLQIS